MREAICRDSCFEKPFGSIAPGPKSRPQQKMLILKGTSKKEHLVHGNSHVAVASAHGRKPEP